MSLRRLAWGLFALYVVLQAATLWVIWDGPNGAGDAIGAVVLGYAFVGALVASRHPRGPVGWLLLAIALVFSVDMFGESYAYYSTEAPGYTALVAGASLAFSVWVFLAAVVLPLVFPDGQRLSGRWRRMAWIGAAVFVGVPGGDGPRAPSAGPAGGCRGPGRPQPARGERGRGRRRGRPVRRG